VVFFSRSYISLIYVRDYFKEHNFSLRILKQQCKLFNLLWNWFRISFRSNPLNLLKLFYWFRTLKLFACWKLRLQRTQPASCFRHCSSSVWCISILVWSPFSFILFSSKAHCASLTSCCLFLLLFDFWFLVFGFWFLVFGFFFFKPKNFFNLSFEFKWVDLSHKLLNLFPVFVKSIKIRLDRIRKRS